MEETLSSLVTTPYEESSRPYSTLLGQEDIQQELVVKAIKVKKRSRRQQGKLTWRSLASWTELVLWPCPGSSLTDSGGCSRLSDSSFSDSVSMVQHGSCSEGASGTRLSDQALLVCMELQNQGLRESDQEPESEEAKYGGEADPK